MLQYILRLIFPPKCIFCGSLLESDSNRHICGTCYNRIPFSFEKLPNENAGLFRSLYCDDVVCVCEYTGIIREALKKYKFFNKPSYYKAFEELLLDRMKKMTDLLCFDIIISVPLFRTKEKERGYNQSLLISRALSKDTGISEASDALVRIRDTGSQSLLPKDKRHFNVQDAFLVKAADKVKGRKIILVDDVLTTGSTIDECCRVLKQAGAETITALIIASGRKY